VTTQFGPPALSPHDALEVGGFRVGGRVEAITTNGSVAAAIIDTNSDDGMVVFETYWFDNERQAWAPGQSVGAGSAGSATGPTSYIFGRGTPGTEIAVEYRGTLHQGTVGHSGWWLFVWESPDWETAGAPRLARS
jgi:hypothetical protein